MSCLLFVLDIILSVLLRFTAQRIGGIMVGVLASSVVDGGFEPRSGQTKDYKIGICCFSARHAALLGERAKTGWLGIRIMCPSGVLFQ